MPYEPRNGFEFIPQLKERQARVEAARDIDDMDRNWIAMLALDYIVTNVPDQAALATYFNTVRQYLREHESEAWA